MRIPIEDYPKAINSSSRYRTCKILQFSEVALIKRVESKILVVVSIILHFWWCQFGIPLAVSEMVYHHLWNFILLFLILDQVYLERLFGLCWVCLLQNHVETKWISMNAFLTWFTYLILMYFRSDFTNLL